MPAKYDTIPITVAVNSGAGAAITAAYPFGKSADDYLGGTDHFIASNAIRTLFALARDFTIDFGPTLITVTLTTGEALPGGTVIYLNVDRSGEDFSEALVNPNRMALMATVRYMFGAVATAVATAACVSQSVAAAANAILNGTLAAGSPAVVTFDVPRNVVAAWTGAAVLTVYGTDENGSVTVESSASGVTFTGKKSFKTITRITVNAAVTALTAGNGVVLGLPGFLADAGDVLKELVNGANATAGVVLAGDQTVATALTGSVHGTWAPNAAPNGTNVYEMIAAVRSFSYRGRSQFAG